MEVLSIRKVGYGIGWDLVDQAKRKSKFRLEM